MNRPGRPRLYHAKTDRILLLLKNAGKILATFCDREILLRILKILKNLFGTKMNPKWFKCLLSFGQNKLERVLCKPDC